MRTSSKVTIAGSDTSDGVTGLTLKSVFTFTFRVEIAYSASFREKMPASSVSSAVGAISRPLAPRTAFSSYTLPPSIESPSTSKKVMCMRSKAGICSLVPVCTKRKSNSAPRNVAGVPSTHSAVAGSSADPEPQYDVRSPKPRQAKPVVVKMACEVVTATGFWYSMTINSLYNEAGLLTVMSRSKAWPLSVPRFFHRMLPDGRAAPVVSVVSVGMICPECSAPWASTHSMETAGLEVEEKSIVTRLFTQDGLVGGCDGGGACGGCEGGRKGRGGGEDGEGEEGGDVGMCGGKGGKAGGGGEQSS